MAVKCPHCGESSVSWEGYDIQDDDCTQQVCQSCGAILEEGNLQSAASHGQMQGYQNVPVSADYISNGTEAMSLPKEFLDNLQSITRTHQLSEGHKLGKDKIKKIFQMVGVDGKHLIPEAIRLYNRCLKESPFFSKQHLPQKELLAAVCVLIVCRDHDIPLTVNMLCMMINSTESAFNAEFFKIQKIFGIKLKQLEIDSYVERLCDSQPNECVQRTKQVLSIARKTWLTEGCYRDALIMAANYYAWQSLEFLSRYKVTLQAYVKTMPGWKWAFRIKHRHKEIGDMLCSLASGIPWLATTEVTRKTVSLHLKDIISYQKSLFRQIESAVSQEDAAVTSSDVINHSPDVTTPVNGFSSGSDEQIKSSTNTFDGEDTSRCTQSPVSEVIPTSEVRDAGLFTNHGNSTEVDEFIDTTIEVHTVESFAASENIQRKDKFINPVPCNSDSENPLINGQSISAIKELENVTTKSTNKRSITEHADRTTKVHTKRPRTNLPTSKGLEVFVRWSNRSKPRNRENVPVAENFPVHPNIDSETVGEEDIPESDMNDYIKRDNEISDLALLRYKRGTK